MRLSKGNGMKKNIVHYAALTVLLNLACIASVQSADAFLQADEAVADILFDYDFGASFATYSVNDSGFVSISFARNMPDALYSEILGQLKNHSQIKGVLAGKSAPPCNAW